MMKKLSIIFIVVLPLSLAFSACTDTGKIPAEYDSIIKNIISAYPWDDSEANTAPENPELSYMYRHHSTLSEVGFALIDLDGNGQRELLISGMDSQYVYDMYTIINGQAVQVFSSGERYSHYLYRDGTIELQWSNSAAQNGHDFYKFSNGQLEFLQRVCYDAYLAEEAGVIAEASDANDDNCYFKSDSENKEEHISISAAEAVEIIDSYRAHEALNIEYIPLSEVALK